ncbi:zinc finger protein 410-like [Oppia nitens]|uniref:zinc finger protein 410-like n=1 Tax=Oppia nitens TaxID=1686743 RepID=UPI0023DA851D|nr:zinc finger protein 410-like [Oppia nitens]
MDMLKSEVKLLLLRNGQLEDENRHLKQSELRLRQQLYHEKQLTKVLDQVKLAQNEYISKLNGLIIELTNDNTTGAAGSGGSGSGGTGAAAVSPAANGTIATAGATDSSVGQQLSYHQLKLDINNCVKVCKQLQTEYESCKKSIARSSTSASASVANNNNSSYSSSNRHLKSSNAANTSSSSAAAVAAGHTLLDVIETDDAFTDRLLEDIADEDLLEDDDDYDNVNDNDEDDDDDDDDDQPMPELDLIDDQFDDNTILFGSGLDNPNNGSGVGGGGGGGVQYLDMTDTTEFIPKRTLPKGARKSFPNNIQTNLQSPRKRKSDNRGYKTSHKFGDKYKCNWKGCEFISSYKQNVERHYRVHTGERPFKCQFKGCTFSASQAGNLKVHQQRHGHQTPNAHKIRIRSTHSAAIPIKMSSLAVGSSSSSLMSSPPPNGKHHNHQSQQQSSSSSSSTTTTTTTTK